MAAARAGVHKDVPPGRIVAGSPHMSHMEWLKMEACLPKLPEMREALAEHRIPDELRARAAEEFRLRRFAAVDLRHDFEELLPPVVA